MYAVDVSVIGARTRAPAASAIQLAQAACLLVFAGERWCAWVQVRRAGHHWATAVPGKAYLRVGAEVLADTTAATSTIRYDRLREPHLAEIECRRMERTARSGLPRARRAVQCPPGWRARARLARETVGVPKCQPSASTALTYLSTASSESATLSLRVRCASSAFETASAEASANALESSAETSNGH